MLLKISVIVAHMHFQSLESFAGFVTKIGVDPHTGDLSDAHAKDLSDRIAGIVTKMG